MVLSPDDVNYSLHYIHVCANCWYILYILLLSVVMYMITYVHVHYSNVHLHNYGYMYMLNRIMCICTCTCMATQLTCTHRYKQNPYNSILVLKCGCVNYMYMPIGTICCVCVYM